MAENLFSNSSSNPWQQMKEYQRKRRGKQINFQAKISKDYSPLFTIIEFQVSVAKVHNTAVDPHEIRYELFKSFFEK